jgi:hypothetical protein
MKKETKPHHDRQPFFVRFLEGQELTVLRGGSDEPEPAPETLDNLTLKFPSDDDEDYRS